MIVALVLSACASGRPSSAPPVPAPLDPAICAARVAETETFLRAAEGPDDERRSAPWIAAALTEVRGRCPDLPEMDAVLLRLGNAAFTAGNYWLARQAFAELSARFPDSGFNFEDSGGRRARLIDSCATHVSELDPYVAALLAARYARRSEAIAAAGRAARSLCPALREAANELLAALNG